MHDSNSFESIDGMLEHMNDKGLLMPELNFSLNEVAGNFRLAKHNEKPVMNLYVQIKMSVYPAHSDEQLNLGLNKKFGYAAFSPGKESGTGRDVERLTLPAKLFTAEAFFFYAESIWNVLEKRDARINRVGEAIISGLSLDLERDLNRALKIKSECRDLYTPLEQAVVPVLSLPRYEVDEKRMQDQKNYFPGFFQL